MKISYRLLNEYIDLQSADPYEIAPAIAEHCFEVEFINKVGGPKQINFTNVFAAKVSEVQKHPNADRLRVVQLDLGDRAVGPVVCGAFNFEAGDIVALALPGAHIPQNIHSDTHEAFELGSAKIRGVISHGMICSGFELGLQEKPEESPVILILPAEIKPGTDLREYFSKTNGNSGLTDYLFDFAMPANRPDLHSHIGVAQELSGMLGYKKTKLLQNAQREMAEGKPFKKTLKSTTKVSVESEQCSSYQGARIRVVVGQTPEELMAPLRTLGHTGVNNVVDITNLVMAITGQPLHTYDAAKVQGDIVVRNATAGEKIVALDAKEYVLPKNALVIADKRQILGIAGIIGGNQSKIVPETQEIILESAVFERTGIRRTSKAVGLRTEASGLFEKGTTEQQSGYAFELAIRLLEEHAGGVVLEKFGSAPLHAKKDRSIKFKTQQINDILGGEWNNTQIKKILHGLGIIVSGSGQLTAQIPWYRQDLEDPAGIADELVRFIGMNVLDKQPLRFLRSEMQYNREDGIWKAKDAAALLGYAEVQGYSFISAAEIADAGREIKDFIRVSNPLSAETEYLRRDLGEGLLKIAGMNSKHSDSFKLFEIGFGYHGYDQEKLYLGLAVYKPRLMPEMVVAEIKGDLQTFIHGIDVAGEFVFGSGEDDENILPFYLRKNNQSKMMQLGVIAVIDPANRLPKRFDLDHEVVVCQLQLDAVLAAVTSGTFVPFSRFPESSIDISIVVAYNLSWNSVETIIRSNSAGFLKRIEVLDARYKYPKSQEPLFHKNLAKEGLKNLVFRLVFADPKGTLQDSEISKIYAKIKTDLQTQLNAEIR